MSPNFFFHADQPLLPTANPVATIKQDPTGNLDDYTLACDFNVLKSNITLQAEIKWFIDGTVVEKSLNWTSVNESAYTVYMNRSKLTGLKYGTQVWHIYYFILIQH